MSMRTIAASSPKRASASVRASSVLPTPVGPKNRKEPIGRLGSESPALALRIASATAITPSSWPTTLSCSCSSRRMSRALHLGELGDGDAGGTAHHLRYVLGRHLSDGAAGAVARPVQLGP